MIEKNLRIIFQKSSIFLVLYTSLIIGFILNENTLGGSINDYYTHKSISQKFSNNFLETLLYFDKESTRHSPLLLIIFSFFEKFRINDNIIRIINLHFLLLTILFFYKSLKIKFNNYNNFSLYLISLLLFISPTFRSLSIWPDSRMYGLFFFVISIYFYLIFIKEKNEKKKFQFAILNTLLLCISSYFSPNFSLYAIFFLISFFNYYKISKYFFLICFINFILSTPALYYIFYLKIYFFFVSVSDAGKSFIALNPANKILLISSIILFYFTPFLFITKNIFKVKKNYIIYLGLIFIICIYFFNYEISFTGGGIIFKLSNILFNNNYLFYFFSFLACILIMNLCFKNLNNSLLITLIILGNPQLEIYHKYYDPMLLIIFFTLFDLNFSKILLKKRIFIFYIFNFLFLIANIMK